MVNAITGSSYSLNAYASQKQQTRIIPRDLTVESSTDTLSLGKGEAVDTNQAMNVVLERAMDKLRSVVSDARQALGMADNAQIDTSPEATASRIADFALGMFDKWRGQHTGLSDDDARQQFADYIGNAIQDGIEEARGILTSLNALNGEVDTNINKTWENVQQRLKDFVSNGQ